LAEETKAPSAAEHGVFLHRAMEHLDFTFVQTMDQLRKFADGLYEKGFLPNDALSENDLSKIHAFLCSDLGKRLSRAKRIWREEKFTLLYPVAKLGRNFSENAENSPKILIQGVIDCFFEENDEKSV
jgi:ATP-dependent helicase/nuclease subunit A